MKRLFTIVFICLASAAALFFAISASNGLAYSDYESEVSLKERAGDALSFAKSKGLRTDYAVFVDYSIPSGSPRLFVWDFKAKKIVARTYVMHGSGGGSTAAKPVFSNKRGSYCSSLGKFQITHIHGASLKRSFRMKGYDNSNDNAWKRGIMVHRSKWVDSWNWKKYIPLHEKSCQGCITVGTNGMNYLEKLINGNKKKNLLLWSYCSKK